MIYFNRYQKFIKNNKMHGVPFIEIPHQPSDKTVVYKRGVTRFDKLSFDYYGSPFFDFIIKSANMQNGGYEGMEFDIPNGTNIRIPFPLSNAIKLYNDKVQEYIKLYGIE